MDELLGFLWRFVFLLVVPVGLVLAPFCVRWLRRA